MSALAWTLRVTVSLATKVPAPGLKRTARRFAWAAGEDPRLDAHASRTRPSTPAGLVDSTSGSCSTSQPVSPQRSVAGSHALPAVRLFWRPVTDRRRPAPSRVSWTRRAHLLNYRFARK